MIKADKMGKKFQIKSKAFTLQEVLLSIVVFAVIATIVTPVVKSIGVNREKLGIKKANQTLHETIQNMLNDGEAYSADNDFSDTSLVVWYDGNGNPINAEGINKFSSVFFSKLKLAQYSSKYTQGLDYEPCEILLSDGVSTKDGRCYRTEDDIVWGVPATDFKNYNVIKIDNNGYQVAYVPITVYPVFESKKMEEDENYFEDKAVFFAIKQDGDIRVVTQVDCEAEGNQKKLQCKAIDYIAETSI